MMQTRMKRSERGSVMPILAFVSIILAVLGIGGAVMGRVVAARQDAQRAADGAALAAADLIREEGMQSAMPRALQVGQYANRTQLGFDPDVTEEPTRLVTRVVTRGRIEAPRFIWNEGVVAIERRAQAMVGQEIHRIDEWLFPKVVLVLDYSGSMDVNFGGRRRLDALEDSVQRILDSGFRMEFAAVLFSDDDFAHVGFGPDSPQRVRDMLRDNDARSSTCTSCGLRRAHEIFEDTPENGADKFVILASDGEPNAGGGEQGARAEAQRLWDFGEEGQGVSIFSLHIGAGGALQSFMESVSGTPDHHPDPENYYFQVTDPQSLREALEAIAAAIACRTPNPVNLAAVEDMATLRVFLREGGRERRIQETRNLGAAGNTEAYQFERGSGRIRFTPRACGAIIDRGAQIVVRYNRAKLIE